MAEVLGVATEGVVDGDGAVLVETLGDGPFAAGWVALLLQADTANAIAAARMAAEETLWALMPRMLGGHRSTVLSQPSRPSTEIDSRIEQRQAGEVQETIPASQGYAHCPLTSGGTKNSRWDGLGVQPISWVRSSTCVREARRVELLPCPCGRGARNPVQGKQRVLLGPV